MTLYGRVTLVLERGGVEVFYPVFYVRPERRRRRRLATRREGVKLVTFDEGRVGRVDGEEIAVLDAPTMREYFERGAQPRPASAFRSTRAPPGSDPSAKKFIHTAGNFREHEEESKNVGWSHQIAPWIVFFQNVDAIVGPDEAVVYPEHLTEEARLRARAGGRHREGREAFLRRRGDGLRRRLRDLQRHHRTRHPAPRDGLGGVLVLQGDRHVLPARPWIVTPDEVPDPQDLRMELRVNGKPRQVSHSGNMSVTIPEIVAHYSPLGYSAGDVVSTGTFSGVAGFSEDAESLYLRPGDVMEARSSASESCAPR